ncbi:hypothetical protein M0804_000405 [Polistes exclamans]|nr:hypothetical protein M0804_000405 [Polistes exclamans]
MGPAWNVKSSEGEGLYRCYSEEPTGYPFALGAELVFETDRKFFQLNRTRCLLLVRFRRLDDDDDDDDKRQTTNDKRRTMNEYKLKEIDVARLSSLFS